MGNHDAAAAAIWSARAERRTLDAVDTLGTPTLEEAYEIQAFVTARRLARGERIVGWKLGYTSAAMRRQMGVDDPNFGPLTDAMLLADGDEVAGELVQPRVEPEIALRFARDLHGPTDRSGVLAAVGSVHACLEVVHSTWTGYRFTLEHNTADGSSAAQVVLGSPLGAVDLAAVEVELSVDGEVRGSGVGADASGHPADGVIWLLEQLGDRGLRAREVVITGGLTAAAPLAPGSTISAQFSGGGLPDPVHVSVRRAPA